VAAHREREALIEAIPVGVYKYRMLAAGGVRFEYVSQRCSVSNWAWTGMTFWRTRLPQSR
jgi:hypothetical protein